MNNDGMLVSERWLTNADQILSNLTAPHSKRARGVYYEIRPCSQITDWTRDGNGPWTTSANPIKEGTSEPDAKTTFKVIARTLKPETSIGDRFWAVLRGGRWEYLVGDNGQRFTRVSIPSIRAEPKIVLNGLRSFYVPVPKFTITEMEVVTDVDIEFYDVGTGETVTPSSIYYFDPNSGGTGYRLMDYRMKLTTDTILVATQQSTQNVEAAVTATTTEVMTDATIGSVQVAEWENFV